MDKKVNVLMLSVCLIFLATVVQAREFKEVNVPEDIRLTGVHQDLKPNGVGVRTKFFFDIYIGALYLETVTKVSEGVLKEAMLNAND